jgi:PAS domain S-box-containing protein
MPGSDRSSELDRSAPAAESVDQLRSRADRAEETLRAIRGGEVDALVVSTSEGDQVFTLTGADEPYRVMLEQMSEGAASVSSDGVIMYANSRLAEMLALPLSALVGSPVERLVAPDQRAGLAHLFESQDRGGRNSGEFGLVAADGVRVEVNLSVTPLPAGTSSAWSMVATDITERVRRDALLREASEYARSLIEASLDPLVTISAEGKITDVNEATVHVTGVARGQLIGTDFSEYFTEPEKAREGYRRVFAEGSVVDYPLTIRRRAGALTDVLYNASVYRDASGNVLGVFAAARDVTERKRAESLLQARERQQQAVAELGYLALTNPGLEALLDAAAVAVAGALDVEFAKVLQLRSNGDLILRAGVGFDQRLVGHAVVPGGTGSEAGYVLLAGEPVIVDDLGAETRFHPAALLTDHGVRSGVSVALGPRERPFGVIGAHTTTKRQFTRDDILFLAAVSNVIGTALQRAHAEDAARRQAEQHEAILATTSDGFWVYDPAGRILDVNDVYCRMSGYTREELLRMRIVEIDAIMTEPQIGERMRHCTRSGFDRFETVHRTKEGDLFDVEISMAYSRKQDQFVLFARDVSERKQAEREIRTLNTELEQRVTQRTEQLRATNEELQAFVYSVSHDLRAPLRAMDGFSAMLLEGYAEQLDQAGQHYLARVRAAAQRMGTMIDELLGLSRVSRAELHRDQIDLSDLARQIADELQTAEPERRVEFAIPDGLTATGDRELVRIVLENLLGNAWKFTSTRQHARIEIAGSEHDGRTEFVVRDNGVGFDMEHAGQLFKAFQRLHRANEFPGTGIGLVSVHRIITRHGGQIRAQGEIDRGATFTFTLEPKADAR